jgi:hypothetical protein
MAPTGKYQLVVLGHEGDGQVVEHSQKLSATLANTLSHLGLNVKKFLTEIPSGSAGAVVDRRMPTVAIFFGVAAAPKLGTLDTARLAQLIGDGILIIPVVAETARFSELVPVEIAHLNGVSFADCGAEFERLTARVLEGLGLLRETRRIFISYRRVETSGVAAQLYEALDEGGFDVFLDTHGVLRPGEPFQDILWHRLADTDVAVLLDSPGFLASRWTEEELARANTSNIQILQVLWPGQQDGAPAAFSTFQPLTADDFEDIHILGPHARLRTQAVHDIVDAVESLRARAIGARHTFLVREFVQEARGSGLTVRTTLDRSLIVSGHGGDPILVQPAVGVPNAERYEVLDVFHQRELAEGRQYSVPPILLYDQTGIRSRWLEHLKWLNGSVTRVRSISLADARTWLDGIPRTMTAGGL